MTVLQYSGMTKTAAVASKKWVRTTTITTSTENENAAVAKLQTRPPQRQRSPRTTTTTTATINSASSLSWRRGKSQAEEDAPRIKTQASSSSSPLPSKSKTWRRQNAPPEQQVGDSDSIIKAPTSQKAIAAAVSSTNDRSSNEQGTALARGMRPMGAFKLKRTVESESLKPDQKKKHKMLLPPPNHNYPAKRIKLEDNNNNNNNSSNGNDSDESKGKKKTYTDFCYRKSSRSSGHQLTKVAVDASTVSICPAFAKGVTCLDPVCRLRHDVDREASRPFCRYFQFHGQCFREDCPFRHVKVNPAATPCPTFSLLGYCDDSECTLMHTAASTTATVTTTLGAADKSSTQSKGASSFTKNKNMSYHRGGQ